MPQEIKKYLIGISVFTMLILGVVSTLAMFMGANPEFMPEEQFQNFNKTFNKYNELDTNVGNLQEGLEDPENTDWGTFGVLNALISGAWQTLRLTVSSLSFMTTALVGAYTTFGVPLWIISILSMIITIMIVYAIYGAVFQR